MYLKEIYISSLKNNLLGIGLGFLLSLSAAEATNPELNTNAELATSQLCASVLGANHLATLKSSDLTVAEYSRVFSKMFANRENGLTDRGYLGAWPEETAMATEVAEEFGIMPWALRIFVRPNLEAAQQHARQDFMVTEKGISKKDSTNSGLYFIGSPEENVSQGQLALKTYEKILNQGAYYFPNLNNTEIYEFIAPEKLKQILNLGDEPKWSINKKFGPMIGVHGWCFQKIRGIVDFADSFAHSTYQKIYSSLIYNLFEDQWATDQKGEKILILQRQFRVTFNTAPEQALDALKIQDRNDQELKDNRYFDAHAADNRSDTYLSMLERIRKGTAYSVEVWDIHNNELIAGSIISRTGNFFSADSVFYKRSVRALRVNQRRVNDSFLIDEIDIDGIVFAQISAFAWMEKLFDSGFADDPNSRPTWMDLQVVTRFSHSLYGYYVPASEFVERKQKLSARPLAVSLAEWQPRSRAQVKQASKHIKTPRAKNDE